MTNQTFTTIFYLQTHTYDNRTTPSSFILLSKDCLHRRRSTGSTGDATLVDRRRHDVRLFLCNRRYPDFFLRGGVGARLALRRHSHLGLKEPAKSINVAGCRLDLLGSDSCLKQEIFLRSMSQATQHMHFLPMLRRCNSFVSAR